MNRYLSNKMGSKSKSLEDVKNWIESVIMTSSSPNHREVCEKLVTNFTNNVLLFNNQDLENYRKVETSLRKLIIKKFN
jgi:hypothetical protein